MKRVRMSAVGAGLLALVVAAAVAAPALAPHDPATSFRDRAFAPADAPARRRRRWVVARAVRLSRAAGRPAGAALRGGPLAPVAAVVLVGRAAGAASPDERDGPWLPLGADGAGRDVLARLLFGARTSLGLALAASLAAILIGVAVGSVAGYAGGAIDEILMRVAEFVLVLPAVYVVLALRAVLPLVLSPWTMFLLMTGIFALVGWPWVARAVRGDRSPPKPRATTRWPPGRSAPAPRACSSCTCCPRAAASSGRRPSCWCPAFVLAEATLSYLGLGFPDSVPSWGSMLQDAANVNVLARFPWMLAPARPPSSSSPLSVNLALRRR